MNLLNKTAKDWSSAGFRVEVKPAPKDAQTFDKMLIIFNRDNKIRQVSLYSTEKNRFMGNF